MADLWSNQIFDQSIEIEESNAVPLLREQARLLSKKTGGLVKASFTKIGNGDVKIPEGLMAFMDNTARIISQLAEIPTEELKNKKDLSKEYEASAYTFEIYSEKYKFRVFEVIDRKLFPVTIICDEDIAKQIGILSQSEIMSNNKLEKIVTQILASIKLKSIIGRMMKEAKLNSIES